MECAKCGKTDDETVLFDVISDEGIVKICGGCNAGENFPIIRSPGQKKEISAGQGPSRFRRDASPKEGDSMREVLEKSFNKSPMFKGERKSDLVENFHWIIMRARRGQHLSPRQIAEEIGVDAVTILRAERAILPEDYHELIIKLENFLGVGLIKDSERESVERVHGLPGQGKLGINPSDVVGNGVDINELKQTDLTIADLQRMKEEREKGFVGEKDEPDFIDDLEDIGF